MRVLVANIPLPENRFLVDLNRALSEFCEVEQSSEVFWNMQDDGFDIVHLHFPEYLTFELTKAYIEGLKSDLIEAVEERLKFWSRRARLVVTRHVLLPHDALEDPAWEEMYSVFYRYADAVAHFGQASVAEFRNRYKDLAHASGIEPLHRVIPHQNYASLPNTVGRREARERLGLHQDADVMLIFGAIRSDEERDLIMRTFSALASKRKILLVSRWRETPANVSWIRLKYWLRDLNRFYYRLHPEYSFNYDFVPESDTQLYLNAADVLFIPRLRVLNSGNVTLGMTFGRVVVGPDSFDVGEILRETGNPVYDPGHPESAVAAVEKGMRLARTGEVGRGNQELALSLWAPEKIAAGYFDFFNETTKRNESV